MIRTLRSIVRAFRSAAPGRPEGLHDIKTSLWLLARTIAAALLLCTLLAPRGPSAAVALRDLGGVDELKGWFNAGKGHVRLILLLSPT